MLRSNINKRRIFQILSEVKLEQKLNKIFEEVHNDFDIYVLPIIIQCSFETMTAKFKHDCFQHNAHMNYLKLSPVLKQSINILCKKMDSIFTTFDQNIENPNAHQNILSNCVTIELKEVMVTVTTLLNCTAELQQQCMIYVEVSFIDKFLSEHIFRLLSFERLVQLSSVCLSFIENSHTDGNVMCENVLQIACTCLSDILKIQAIFNESNNFYITQESHSFFNRLLAVLYEIVKNILASKSFLEKNQLKQIISQRNQTDRNDAAAELSYAKAIFLGVFVECCYNNVQPDGNELPIDLNKLNSFKDAVLSLIIATLRSDSFYFFAITPREIINSFDWQHNPNRTITFQSVPIDCLNEIDIVEKFLKR